ncbi:MAG: TonB-dependent receptor [Candidatus Eremiobacteraeota bacterium]|nr:TonB-dependent receptor [Candidatus Eremiobacteraeota bacterium]
MLKRSVFAAAFVAAILANAAGSPAGTTGTISGVVVSTAGPPVAGARVAAVSPSGSLNATTDAAGHFVLLSLAPDTYTITVQKGGFETSALTGISVFADQVQQLRIALTPSLKTIAHVTTRSSMDVVKPGTTSDVYSVNATVASAAAGIGGGGGLNNAYSAIATVPGTFVPPNQQGWFQTVYIRGGDYSQVGYEFDGVPVNRSFDNYPGSTAGTLGQQELQVYAGGGTVGQSTSGLSGFINQVIKTGTFPGFATADFGLGAPAYYHNVQVEVGGATPDRLFSYYAGIGGYNQDYRVLDQFNGASLGDVWGYPNIAYNTTIGYEGGVYPTCGYVAPTGSAMYQGPNASAIYDPFLLKPGQPGYIAPPPGGDVGCYNTVTPAYSNTASIGDRESVFNFHIGIPHKHDGGRDDVQLLYNIVGLHTQYYSSADDLGQHLVQQLNQYNVYRGCNVPGSPDCKAKVYAAAPEIWGDFVTWPSGTIPGQSAVGLSAIPYFQPGSTSGRCANVAPSAYPNVPLPSGACAAGTYSAVPLDARDAVWNDASIVKLQYQHNIGSSAYIRLYGYTFYSDWLQTSPLSYASGLFGFGVTSYDYELESHTRGVALTFADQLNAEHLLTFDTNYTTAGTNRFNNTQFNETLDTGATSLTNGSECFAMYGGLGNPGAPPGPSNPAYKPGQVAPCNSPLTSGTYGDPTLNYYCALYKGCLTKLPAGASWQVTTSGSSGFLNTVTPNFTAVGLSDQWNPTDQLNIQLGIRDENYQYDLANTSNDGQNFWFTAGQREFCYNPETLVPYFIPSPPASGLPATPFIGFNCPLDRSIASHPVQTVHPDGKDGHLLLSNSYAPTVNDNAFTPRLGLTYTINPDTVLRFSAGRFAQQPQTYQVQYNSKDSNLAYDLFQAFWQYGFTTPRHEPLVQYSNNYDASYERRFKGTDMSVKLTPYYRYATNQIYGISLPFGLGGGLNSGIERVSGVEFEFTKGDFDKNGLSMLLSYTYTNAAEKWTNYPGTSVNPIDQYNQDIANFNGLTKAGGGAKCYINNGSIYRNDPTCAAGPKGFGDPILNPYYGMSPQATLDRNAWYPVGLDFAYLSPNVASLLVNYRHNKFAITPALEFNEGQPYGSPSDVYGYDPRTCSQNSAHAGITTATSPYQANWIQCSLSATQSGTSAGSLFIPNPQTGSFASFGTFRQPSQLNLSLTTSYDISPRVKVTALLTNLVNACFGGTSAPWTKQFPPNSYTCGYISNFYYVSNFYNGKSPNDVAANHVPLNPAFATSYGPAYADTNSLVLPGPFNAYFSVNVKL